MANVDGKCRCEYYESSEHQYVHHGYFSELSLFDAVPGTLSEARRLVAGLSSEDGRMTLDSVCAASTVVSVPLVGTVELAPSGTGGGDPAPRDRECAFSMPGTAIEVITPSAFALALAAWERALPEPTTPPFGAPCWSLSSFSCAALPACLVACWTPLLGCCGSVPGD